MPIDEADGSSDVDAYAGPAASGGMLSLGRHSVGVALVLRLADARLATVLTVLLPLPPAATWPGEANIDDRARFGGGLEQVERGHDDRPLSDGVAGWASGVAERVVDKHRPRRTDRRGDGASAGKRDRGDALFLQMPSDQSN